MAEREAYSSLFQKALFLVLVFFFFSGVTGLIYEILWTRMIVKIIGGAPFAVTIILTVFMGGLGLGSYVASRTIDRIQEPLKLVRIYGLLELIIGLYALAIPLLLVAFRPLQAVLYNQLFSHFMLYNFLTFVSSVIILIIPIICMGATLPILCKFYVTGLSRLGTHTGRLYGLNTVGAAAGALICGFWLLDVLGELGTLMTAVIVNVTIGLACQALYFRAKKFPLVHVRVDLDTEESRPKEALYKTMPQKSSFVLNSALIIFAVSGFCAMAYEVIWTKLLGLIVGPTTYSFTIVLVTFITGLGLGSFVFGWLADRLRDPLRLLIITQIAACLFVIGTSQLLGNSQLFFSKLIYSFRDQFVLLSLLKAALLFLFMVFPTLCLGAAFPLVGKIYTPSVSKVGRSIGFAYALNTLGAVLGSFCAGFVLLPLLGKENSLSFLISLQLLASLVIAFLLFGIKMKSIKKLAPLALSAVLGLILCVYYPSWNQKLLSSGKYNRFDYIEPAIRNTGWLESLLRGKEILLRYDKGEVVYYGEGIGGFTTVIKTPDALGNLEYSMANSGKMDASSRGDMKTQTLLAHLPMLFHHSAKKVMILGLASGITAGETLLYPIEHVDVLEINRQVVQASDFFLPWNNDVLSNPKANLIIQDARAHLQLTKQKYDVIVSEPSNPWMAGLATLFSRDFFKIVKERLRGDGVFVQWLHSYNMDWATFSLIGRTFAEIFPKNALVSTAPFPEGRDYLLVGFKGESGLFLKNAQKNHPYIERSNNVSLTDPRLLYRLIVSEDVRKLFGQGPINSDNRPQLEFAAPMLMHLNDSEIVEKLQEKKWLTPQTESIVQELLADVDSQIDFARYVLSLYMPFPDMVDLGGATTEQKESFFKLMEAYCSKNPVDYSIFGNEELAGRCRTIQINAIEQKMDIMPVQSNSTFYLANLYYAIRRLDKAITYYSQSLRTQHDNFYAHNNLGYALMLQGRYKEAGEHFIEALRINPDFAEAHRNLGYNLAAQGKLEEAAREYRTALRLLPRNHTLYNDLGVILARMGKLEEAEKHFREALRIKPDFAEAQKNLEIIKRRK
jgi:spermidine synthase